MPVIRITDTTWDRLKRWATPLEDAPDDAIRKVLEAAEEHLKCPRSLGGRHKHGHYELNGSEISIANLWRKMGATVKTEDYVTAAGAKMRRVHVATFNGIKYPYAGSNVKGRALAKHGGKPSPLLPWIANNPNIRFVKDAS